MDGILGSEFETSLRILLLLQAVCDEALSESTIAALDFIIVYSHDFGITESNLHGDGSYRFGEFASRRITVRTAIKQLVLDGLVNVSQTVDGFHYSLSSNGFEFILTLNSEYADAYYDTSIQVLRSVDISEHALSKLINQRSIASIRRG